MQNRLSTKTQLLLLALLALGATTATAQLLNASLAQNQKAQTGTFWSAQLPVYPPLPINPFPDRPLLEGKDGRLFYNDLDVNYDVIWAENAKQVAQNASLQGEGGGMAMMSMSGGLRLTPPVFDGTNHHLTILEAEPFGIYDLFVSTNFPATNGWAIVGRTAPGQTNLSVAPLVSGFVVYVLGTMQDTDGDSLTDAYENLVGKTSAQQANPNTNGTNILIPMLDDLPRGIKVREFSGLYSRTESWNPCQLPGDAMTMAEAWQWKPGPGGGVESTNVLRLCEGDGVTVTALTGYTQLVWAPDGTPRIRTRGGDDPDWSAWETNIYDGTPLPGVPAYPWWWYQKATMRVPQGNPGSGIYSERLADRRHTLDLHTGGRVTTPPKMRLYSIHAAAVAHTSLEWGSPEDITTNVPGEAITVLGRRCRTNGLVYLALPDGYVTDATPVLDSPYTNYAFNVEATAAELRLFVNGSDYADGQVTVQAGQQVSLVCDLYPPIATITNYQWTIPNEPISNWVYSVMLGEVIDLPEWAKTNSSVNLYWWKRATNFTVQCSVMVEGVAMTAKTTITVQKPFATITAVTQNVVKVDFNYPGSGNPLLHFGDIPGSPGIKFTRTQNALPQWDWLQRISSSRRIRFPSAGVWTNWIGVGLDTDFPYGGEINYSVTDSPAREVYPTSDRVIVQENFQMNLMYKPSGSAAIYVPIAYVEWSWAGQADRVDGVWVLTSNPAGAIISPPNNDPEPPYPEWSDAFPFQPVSSPIDP